MDEKRIFALADIHFGPGKYNRGRVIGFAQAAYGDGVSAGSKMMQAALHPKKLDQTNKVVPTSAANQERK